MMKPLRLICKSEVRDYDLSISPRLKIRSWLEKIDNELRSLAKASNQL